jgi:hypothetical protein
MRAKIHVAPYFHSRPFGLVDQRTHTPAVFDLLGQYLDACREDQGYHVVTPEVGSLRLYCAANSEHRDFVREFAAAGRIELAGGLVHQNALCIQGESLIRNLQYGRRYAEGVLHVKPTAYLSLASGGGRQLPQILLRSGFDCIVSARPAAGCAPQYALAPDGSCLLEETAESGYRPLTITDFLRTVGDRTNGHTYLRNDLRLLGDDMAGPVDWLIGHSGDLAARNLAISTPQRYLSEVRADLQQGRPPLSVTAHEPIASHIGALVSRSDLKIANRLAENALLSAEKWATLASLHGAKYPQLALDRAWRQALSGQCYDAISGLSNDVSFVDLMAGYRESLELAREIGERALAHIARQIDVAPPTAGGAALVVFNALGWSRTDVCRARVEPKGAFASGFKLIDDRGREIPTQLIAKSDEGEEGWAEFTFIAADVPSVGYRTYYLAPADQMPSEAQRLLDDVIENECFRIEADRGEGGALSSIYDKLARREVLNPELGPANEVIALAEQPEAELGALNLHATGKLIRASDRPAEMAAVSGPVFSQLLISSELPDKCELIQEVTLYHELRRIDLRTTVENYSGAHDLFALSFPLAVEGLVTFEDQFSAIVRRPGESSIGLASGTAILPDSIEAVQNWVDVGASPSVRITDRGKTVGLVPFGARVLIVADYGRPETVRPLMRALLSRGVCSDWLDRQHVTEHAPACDFVISLGVENDYATTALSMTGAAAERLTEGVQKNKWAAILVATDCGGRPAVPMLIAEAAADIGITALTDLLAEALAADQFEIPQIRDFSGLVKQPDEYGVGLANRGAITAAVDSQQTLFAPLFHTAAWGTLPWGSGRLDTFLVPEHKSHVFEHALVPHAGDWREGAIDRAGYEFNNPLDAVMAGGDHAVERALPPSFSLVSVDAPNIIISAVKPAGVLLSEHSASTNEILVRMYEAHGRNVNARLAFGHEPEQAWLADLAEQKVGDLTIDGSGGSLLQSLLKRRGNGASAAVAVDVPACGIISVGARLTRKPETESAVALAPESEAVTPIHCRYWEHNSGAAPMGDQPVTLWLRGPIPLGKNTRFTLGLSNDYCDREISGKVRVIAPPEWPLIPKEVPYRIAPTSQAVYEVMVVVPPDATPCFLRAATEDDGRLIQDVIPIGEIRPLDVSLTREDDGFVVNIANPNHDSVEGQIHLVTSFESWGRAVSSFALGEVTPASHAFHLDAGKDYRFTFAARGEGHSAWAVAKVSWYGRVQYIVG